MSVDNPTYVKGFIGKNRDDALLIIILSVVDKYGVHISTYKVTRKKIDTIIENDFWI